MNCHGDVISGMKWWSVGQVVLAWVTLTNWFRWSYVMNGTEAFFGAHAVDQRIAAKTTNKTIIFMRRNLQKFPKPRTH